MKNIRKIVIFVLCLAVVIATFTFNATAREKTTPVTSLTVGDTIIFTATKTDGTEYVMAAQNGSYRNPDTNFANAVKFTVEAGSTTGSFAFKDPDGKYLSYSGSNSTISSVSLTTVNNAASWTVTFDSTGIATIANVGTTSRLIQFNTSSSRFACYNNSQTSPVIYKVNPSNVVDVDGAHIRLSVHSLELKDQLHIRHFVHITDSSVEIDSKTSWGLQYWTPEDYAALTLVDGQPAFDAEPSQEYAFIETATPNGDDDKYYATTGGIIAADINNVQYIRAYIVIGNTTYYTPIQAYSVATYLSAVEASPSYGVNSDLYKTVEALIAYGEAAAKLFG